MFETCENSCSENSLVLARAAYIIREELFKNNSHFNGDLSREKQNESIPFCMQQFIELLLEGSPSNSIATKRIANVGQLLKFNSVKHKRRKIDSATRHSKNLETPLPVDIGLFLHNTTRQRTLVDFFAKKGLSITHTRVDDIEDQVTSLRCSEYQELGFVCPSSFEKGYFTTTAIDNVDKNFASSTALNSFHGTTLSVFQHTSPDKPFSRKPLQLDLSKPINTVYRLPDSNTELRPTSDCKPDAPLTEDYEYRLSSCDKFSLEWMEKLSENKITNDDVPISFSSFYNRQQQAITGVSNIVLLPLLEESINSPAMVRHSVEVLTRITRHVNENQITVITADQPVYTLGKQIQWKYKEECTDVFWMMGSLHTY